MLTISVNQLSTLRNEAWQGFEEEMVSHCRIFSPTLCGVLGEPALTTAVRAAIRRATRLGLVLRGPIRLFIEASFLFGSAFDTDPQYTRLSAILRLKEPEMARAELLHRAINRYLQDVAGPDNAHVREALLYLRALAAGPLELSGGVIEDLRQAYPKKAAWVGEEGLDILARQAVEEARKLGFATRRQAMLLVVLKFAFGHGCSADPLYPWIENTLRDPRIVDSTARAQRLERKARTWLDHVLDGPNTAGAPA